jgi:rare lipoprotein A
VNGSRRERLGLGAAVGPDPARAGVRIAARVRPRPGVAAGLGLLFLLSACATSHANPTSAPRLKKGKVQVGVASWYGPGFHGKPTASGEVYDMHALTAAHRTLPLGTLVEVRNLENGRRLVARINDRGPHVRGRIVDLSMGAAQALGLDQAGTARVRLTVLRAADRDWPPASYWIQVGSFREEKNARALQNALEREYPQAEVTAEDDWFRVQIPSGDKRRAAEALRRDLRREGFRPLLVRRISDRASL